MVVGVSSPSSGAAPSPEGGVGRRVSSGTAWTGSFSASYGNYDTTTLAGYVSGGILPDAAADLAVLPGAGPVTATRILEWRTRNGRFSRVEQLREIEGIGERRFAQLRELVTV